MAPEPPSPRKRDKQSPPAKSSPFRITKTRPPVTPSGFAPGVGRGRGIIAPVTPSVTGRYVAPAGRWGGRGIPAPATPDTTGRYVAPGARIRAGTMPSIPGTPQKTWQTPSSTRGVKILPTPITEANIGTDDDVVMGGVETPTPVEPTTIQPEAITQRPSRSQSDAIFGGRPLNTGPPPSVTVSTSGTTFKDITSRLARIYKKANPAYYKVGEIFATNIHRSDRFQENKPVADESQDYDARRTLVGGTDEVLFTERRKLIVVVRMNNHCITLPIHTNAGKGMSKNNKNFFDYIPIRDVAPGVNPDAGTGVWGRDPSGKDDVKSYGVLWSYTNEAVADFGWAHSTEKTSVHITAPYIHYYDDYCAKIGKLHSASLVKLQRLYAEATLARMNLHLYTPAEATSLRTIGVPHSYTRLGPPLYQIPKDPRANNNGNAKNANNT